jgi:hypothetical protein
MKPINVYLDQNQWIYLGRAYYQTPQGEKYSAIFEQVELSSKNGRALFPLSSSHFIETGKRRNVESRKRLAEVMATISRGWTLAPIEYLVPNQIRAVIAEVFNQRKLSLPSAIGRGVAFAFGNSETLHKELGVSQKEAKQYQDYSSTPEGLHDFLVGNNEALLSDAVEDFINRENSLASNIEKYRNKVKPLTTKAERKRAYVKNLTSDLYAELCRQLALEG